MGITFTINFPHVPTPPFTRKLFQRGFYKKKRYLHGYASDYDFWVAENIICKYFGHEFEYWHLIARDKCRRCLAAGPKDEKEQNRHQVYLQGKYYYEKLQTPFWKMMGLKPKPKELALDKWLAWRGMTYGDWRKERDQLKAHNPGAVNQFEQWWAKRTINEAIEQKYQKS